MLLARSSSGVSMPVTVALCGGTYMLPKSTYLRVLSVGLSRNQAVSASRRSVLPLYSARRKNLMCAMLVRRTTRHMERDRSSPLTTLGTLNVSMFSWFDLCLPILESPAS